MNVTLLWTGKTTAGYLETGIGLYLKRLEHYVPFEVVTLPDIKRAHLTDEQQKVLEGEALLQRLQPGDRVVLLDEKGKTFTSEAFARQLGNWMTAGVRRLAFVIGGPYGFSEPVYRRADHLMSLSAMTFSHQMVRLIFAEQLYRAFTILRGEPYHHA